ncbi:Smf Predicted Rossmann fold nucleotide-binding protein involved in DNA uptake [Rhabdaerophilaceae bacterium]
MSARLTVEQRFNWLRLARSEGVGPRTFRGLINRFGSAEAALSALPTLAAQRGRRVNIPEIRTIEAEFRMAERLGARLLAYGEDEYPVLLREIDGAPPIIAVRGQLACLARPCIGIVGSRNASAVGRTLAGRFASELGGAGYTIVSGLARGIDAEAHQASLATATVGILAGGLDKPYPPEHAELVEKIIEKGLVISEQPFGLSPRGRDFPRRNRIISGLSLGVIVVEAARRSGSLITARMANEQGRDVFAVPGSPLDPRSEGSNDLIRDGAGLVASARDVLEALEPRLGMPPRLPGLFRENAGDDPLFDEINDLADEGASGLSSAQIYGDDQPEHEAQGPPATLRDRLHAALSNTPIELDALLRLLDVPMTELHIAVFELEIAGQLQRHSGNRVSR